MKIDKEYPATHSMSTTWYAVDAEGNVALMDYNENGPVPHGLEENYIPELILQLPANDTGNIPTASYTEEQVNELLGKRVDLDDLEYGPIVVELKKCREEAFIKWAHKINTEAFGHRAIIRLNPKLDYYAVNDRGRGKEFENMLNNKWFYNIYSCFWEINDIWDKETQSVVWDKTFTSVPFYIYGQPYSNNLRMSKIHTPCHPVKIEQLPPDVQRKATKLPLSFAETRKLQIAEFADCSIMENPRFEYKGQSYHYLPDSNGEFMYIAVGERVASTPQKLSKEEVNKLRNGEKEKTL